ncbi:MAG: riboflavin biosynthesis protein RibF, partial [Geobacteraceae bacterium]|nr:riboflavin biosynthesis protein RibF [Geobacteraceae bacterium]
MIIIRKIDDIPENLPDPVATIGNFDGVHRGHCEIFRRVRQAARDRNGVSVAITFFPHPLKVLAPAKSFKLITTYSQKEALIESSGIDYLVSIPFSREFAGISAGEFVREILVDRIGMKKIIIGYDYAFGRKREGDVHLLRKPLLGRYFSIGGPVVSGLQRGRALGFATANVVPEEELLPKPGVYAVKVEYSGTIYDGACNIGFNPTFKNGELTVEAHILDFEEDIYGRELRIHFIERIRDERKFSDVGDLKKAIEKDVAACREILTGVTLDLDRM